MCECKKKPEKKRGKLHAVRYPSGNTKMICLKCGLIRYSILKRTGEKF